MKLSIGIVGLPNVGKSSLFNALTQAGIASENYAFTTIEPNIGIVDVEDPRITKLAKIVNPERVMPATVEFVDIAGLVKGANKGEGLGNQFLANIREVAAIVQVVRSFEDGDILHVESSIDPERDVDIINTELGLKDIDTVEKRLKATQSKARGDRSVQPQVDFLEKMLSHLNDGGMAFSNEREGLSDDVMALRRELQLLTDKPLMYLANTEVEKLEQVEKQLSEKLAPYPVLAMDVKLESELIEMDEESRNDFMDSYGLSQTGLEKLTVAAYDLLGVISYFTAGEKEVRAWTIQKDTDAQHASGAIHTDFVKNFIAAEVVSYEDFIATGGWLGAKEAGKMRLESRSYVVKDGDVINFKVNV